MTLSIPPYEADVPFRLDGIGRLEVCDKNEAAFFAEVSVRIEAEADDEWEVTEVKIGEQVLSGMNRERMAKVIADALERGISLHVSENFGEALIGARCDAARDMAA